MSRLIKVGINGFGRIGRAILRANLQSPKFEVVVINELNPDVGNVAYQLNYDTTYGSLPDKFSVSSEGCLTRGDTRMKVLNHQLIDEVPWADYNVDIVVDATGVYENVIRARNVSVPHVLITHSPDEVDFTMVIGANQDMLDVSKHKLISSSICDATAMAPVLKIVDQNFQIKEGHITTLHPWLNYQNLSDGPASSWSQPGQIYHHYALGRASVGNMIPKPTSAVSATCKVLDGVTEDRIGSFSYRTPTSIIGSADMTLVLEKEVTTADVLSLFEDAESNQGWKIIKNNMEPLVSSDFLQSEYSAIVDHRWTSVVGANLLKLVLWYDNEWGYASRVCDQIAYIFKEEI